jgi:ABC-type Fe3+ transport system permease subunit
VPLTQTGPGVGPDGFCRSCDQEVKPVVRRFWWHAALLVATAQLFAVIVSVVACFKTVDAWKGLRRRFVSWPAAIHPVGLGVAAAVVAALATAWFADFLNERAERAASCPRCHKVLAEQSR